MLDPSMKANLNITAYRRGIKLIRGFTTKTTKIQLFMLIP